MDIYSISPSLVIDLVKNNPYGYRNVIKRDYTEFYNRIMASSLGRTLAETLYRFCYKPTPTCLTCGSENVGFLEFTTGYRRYCSRACTGTSEANKIGRKNYLTDPTRIKDQIRKSKDTCISRYGVEHWKKTKEGRDHTANTSAKIIKDRFSINVNGRSRKQYTAAARHLTNIVITSIKTSLTR